MTWTVAITGGSCSGKTTIFERLQVLHPEHIFVPEVATMLFRSGYPARPEAPELWTPWIIHFQRAILGLQLAMENWARECIKTNHGVLIADRGAMDSAAYHPEGVSSVCATTGLTQGELHARYDLVIHLESLATAAPDHFSHDSNEHRMEALDEAIDREHATWRAWDGHPNRIFVPGSDLEYKFSCVVDAIADLQKPIP